MCLLHANSWLKYTQFVNKLTGNKKEKRASGLKSCTKDIREFTINVPSRRQYLLLDTPGFDDIDRSDRDILRMIGDWLQKK